MLIYVSAPNLLMVRVHKNGLCIRVATHAAPHLLMVRCALFRFTHVHMHVTYRQRCYWEYLAVVLSLGAPELQMDHN